MRMRHIYVYINSCTRVVTRSIASCSSRSGPQWNLRLATWKVHALVPCIDIDHGWTKAHTKLRAKIDCLGTATGSASNTRPKAPPTGIADSNRRSSLFNEHAQLVLVAPRQAHVGIHVRNLGGKWAISLQVAEGGHRERGERGTQSPGNSNSSDSHQPPANLERRGRQGQTLWQLRQLQRVR